MFFRFRGNARQTAVERGNVRNVLVGQFLHEGHHRRLDAGTVAECLDLFTQVPGFLARQIRPQVIDADAIGTVAGVTCARFLLPRNRGAIGSGDSRAGEYESGDDANRDSANYHLGTLLEIGRSGVRLRARCTRG